MKRLIRFFTTLILCVILVNSLLWSVSISPWGGYAMVGMEDVNAIFDEGKANYDDAGTPYTAEDFTGGMIVGADIGFLRAAQIMAGVTKMSVDAGIATVAVSVESSLTMAMVGYKMPSPSKTTLSLGVFAGMGQLMGKDEFVAPPLVPLTSISYSGQGIVGEVVIGYKSGILELNIGYRYAPITEVTISEDVDMNGDDEINEEDDLMSGTLVNKDFLTYGDETEGAEARTFDFSGLTITLGIRIGPGAEEPERYYEED